jgi:coniferyl-aldehyde dehydrogenase
VAVVNGGPEIAAAFSRLPFDHLLFTGSTAVGREVMKAAAEHLTPVTLELGGKSPALVAPGFDLATAARRIAFAKFATGGQTCVAPDYALVPEEGLAAFLAELTRVVRGFYAGDVERDITAVVNERHYRRLEGILADARERGARVQPLLERDALPGRRMPPVAVLDASDEMRVLKEELFGPVLPVLAYRTLAEAVDYVKAHDRPLAMYVFDDEPARRAMILRQTHAGGVCVNDCLVHVAQDALPFGGIGPSGMGHYHGRDGFKTFSHAKGVFHQSRLNALGLFHPPRGRLARLLMKVMLR